MMTFLEAQKDMRQAYYGGGPGVFASGIVWLTAGGAALLISQRAGVVALLIGGMFIHPLGIALSRLLKRPGSHKKGNPLGQLALESTAVLLIGIFIAFVMFQVRAGLFFPVMLMIIGGRYLLFTTIYGQRIYWLVGGVLAAAGMLGALLAAPFALGAFAGGVIEIVSSIVIIYKEGNR